MKYSQAEIDFMKKDALRRSREMHSYVNNGKNNVQANSIPYVEKKSDIELEQEKTTKPPSEENGSKDPLGGLFTKLFSGGKIDNDKFIIIILIVILAKEGVDLKLLIALGYIIM